MAQNRKARRSAQRSNRGRTSGNVSDDGIYMPRNHADDRVLVGMANLPQGLPLIETEFGDLHEILGLIETGLNAAATPNPDHWFPNNLAAHAALIRAYQGLQASACMCVLGFYTEAKSTLRVVYESAGLARSLAKKTDVAEKWFHGGHWINDKFSRQFAKEMTEGSRESGIPYDTFYKEASKFAHPMAASVLPFLFDSEGRYEPKLYPVFDTEKFKTIAKEITAEALFVAYAFRNAAAEFEAIPGWWHERLAEAARRVTGLPMDHLNQDWELQQERHEKLLAAVRHDEELLDALRADPNSIQNLRKRAADTTE